MSKHDLPHLPPAPCPPRTTTVKLHELPEAVDVRFTGDHMSVDLADGRQLRVPMRWFPWLHAATEAQRHRVELVCNGIGLHWPELKEDLFVLDLLAPEVVPPGRG